MTLKEIKENWRPFEDGEMPLEYLSYTYYNTQTKCYYKPQVYNSMEENIQLYLGESWLTNVELFEDYKVLIDNKLLPVGVRGE